jgi:hypothetical protein
VPRPAAGRKAVGILLGPVSGRSAALSIIGVPLVIFLIIGFKTASGASLDVGGGSGSGQNTSSGSGYPAYPTDTATSASPTYTYAGQSTDSGSGDETSTDSGALATDTDTATASASASASPSSSVSGPAAVVLAAYADINAQNYEAAYELGLDTNGESYETFLAGYGSTQEDTVTIEGVSGDVVTISLTALMDDGSQSTYAGTYTVVGGLITGADLQEVS